VSPDGNLTLGVGAAAPTSACVANEHTRECLAIEVARSLTSLDVILTLGRLVRLYGKPQFIRSDNGAEFTAAAVMRWLRDQQVGPAFIPPGKPWHNGAKLAWDAFMRVLAVACGCCLHIVGILAPDHQSHGNCQKGKASTIRSNMSISSHANIALSTT
jgi:Integrase core domain